MDFEQGFHDTLIPVTALKGVGPKVAEKLARLHIFSVQDLLFHLPIRYEDRTRLTTISSLNPNDHVLIEGKICDAAIVGRRNANLTCSLADGTGKITLRFFHFTGSQRQTLQTTGLTLRCFGEVRRNYQGGLEMAHPEYQIVSPDKPLPLSDKLTSVYPVTKGLHQLSLRKLVDQALLLQKEQRILSELLPESILDQLSLPLLDEALQYVHRPPATAIQAELLSGKHPAQQRLIFEELIAHQLSLQQLRHRLRHQPAAVVAFENKLTAQLLASLPFQLTDAQQRVISEIKSDLMAGCPMLRLVQGDVGSGKTIVAAMAALQVIDAGYQVVLMAPTELLAEQHYKNFQQWLAPMQISIGWLTGSVNGKAREQTLQRIASGEDRIIIGTHALFQADVHFHKLALLIIDEQHRFGVHQRLALSEKGKMGELSPHQLVMTATPIPRTLAMTAYADLDCSVIDELPPGRKPITTVLISNLKRDQVIERVKVNCLQQRQAYWICTLVDESEVLQCQAAEATSNVLQQLLPELRIGLVHGRLKAEQKEAIMAEFKLGNIDLLVSTTVVEVGVDVANASLMIIENPERLGLAQLHQLRGRVGRGDQDSFCVLLYQSPLTTSAEQRLTILRNSQDGFEISRKDLAMRGPGEVLGTKQAGLMRFKMADLLRDKALIPQVKKTGEYLVATMPHLVPLLIKRWIQESEKYANV